jgi:hypothetical protein
VVDLCAELGIDFADLYRSAYPDDRSVPDVNYHSLNSALEDALRERGISTTSA